MVVTSRASKIKRIKFFLDRRSKLMNSKLPFEEEFSDKETSIRVFSKDLDSHDLLWHRDDEERKIIVIKSSGWQIQFDNSIPTMLNDGDEMIIKRGEWHRVIMGYDDLIIKIIRSYDE
jgi:hypothetical protein